MKKRVRPLRECIEQACAQAAAGADAAAVLRECHAGELLTGCRTCSEAMVDDLYDLASVSALDPSDPRAIKVRAQAQKRLEESCP